MIKLSGVEPSLVPPRVTTGTFVRSGDGATLRLRGELLDLGDAPSLAVGFEYRRIEGEDVHARSTAWIPTATKTLSAKGEFSVEVEHLAAGAYEFPCGGQASVTDAVWGG